MVQLPQLMPWVHRLDYACLPTLCRICSLITPHLLHLGPLPRLQPRKFGGSSFHLPRCPHAVVCPCLRCPHNRLPCPQTKDVLQSPGLPWSRGCACVCPPWMPFEELNLKFCTSSTHYVLFFCFCMLSYHTVPHTSYHTNTMHKHKCTSAKVLALQTI